MKGIMTVIVTTMFILVQTGCGGDGGGNGGDDSCITDLDCDATTMCFYGDCSSPYGRTFRFTFGGVTISERDPNGEAWDALGGMPDPFVCAWKNSEQPVNEVCTSTVDDSLTAQFNEYFETALFQEDVWYFGVWDEDISEDDFIGACAGQIDVGKIKSGGFGCNGDYYSDLVVYVEPVL